MNEALVDRIIREKGLAWEEHRLWEPVWQEISDFVFPRRGDMVATLVPGSMRTRRLFDSTAVVAATRLAAALAGAVTPSTIQWFDVEVSVPSGVLIPKQVQDWTYSVADGMFKTLQRSNFNIEIRELYHDLVTYGTAAIFIDEADGQPFFRTLHPKEYAILTDTNNTTYKVVRLIKMTVREMIMTFGFENLALGLQQSINSQKDLDAKIDVIHWISLRSHDKIGFPADNFPVASVYVDEKHKHILKRSGFREWPIPVVRWASTSGESYGRSPAFDALPDILSLNKAEELALRAWAMAVMPPLLARHDGILSKPDLRPARLNFVNDEGSLQWFPPATNLDIETIQREDKRRAIWNTFFMDQVQFIPERGKTPPSAEEVRARLNVMLQILGPTLSQVEHELLIPLLVRVYGILSRSKVIPTAPLIVSQFAERFGTGLNLSFIGPIARAKRQSMSQTLDSVLISTQAAAALNPNVIDNINFDEWIREKLKAELAPRTILRDRDEVEKIRQARVEQMQQAQGIETMSAVSEIAGNLTKVDQATRGRTNA